MNLSAAEDASIPNEFVGIWRRESILVTGIEGLPKEPFEDTDVLWFQARTRYADIRIPRKENSPSATAEAFAGRQTWRAPHLHFQHELDRNRNFGLDEGKLDWDGETLVETGKFDIAGARGEYLERWARCTPLLVATEVWERRQADGSLSGILVRIAEQQLLLMATADEVLAEHRLIEPTETKILAQLGSANIRDQVSSPDWRCIEASS